MSHPTIGCCNVLKWCRSTNETTTVREDTPEDWKLSEEVCSSEQKTSANTTLSKEQRPDAAITRYSSAQSVVGLASPEAADEGAVRCDERMRTDNTMVDNLPNGASFTLVPTFGLGSHEQSFPLGKKLEPTMSHDKVFERRVLQKMALSSTGKTKREPCGVVGIVPRNKVTGLDGINDEETLLKKLQSVSLNGSRLDEERRGEFVSQTSTNRALEKPGATKELSNKLLEVSQNTALSTALPDHTYSSGANEKDILALEFDYAGASPENKADFLGLDKTDWIRHLQVKFAEVEVLYNEEKLLSAWLKANLCLRFSAHCVELCEQSSSKAGESLQKLVADFLDSPLHNGMQTKISILIEVFREFRLEDRFDLSHFFFDGGSMGYRSSLPSKDGDAFEALADGCLEGSRTNIGIGNRFFRRKLSAITKHKKAAKKLLNNTFSNDSFRSVSPRRGNRFYFRRQRASREATSLNDSLGTPPVAPCASGEHPQSQSQQYGWHEDTQRGLLVAHRVNYNGTISVRIKAKIRIPLFQVLAILYETQFYDKWVPYCKKCNRLWTLSKASMIVQQLCDFPWPIKQKENLSYCFGIDALDEFGSVIITSRGLPDDATSYLGCPLPPPMKKIPRVPSSSFLFLLSPFDEGRTTQVELYALIDPAVNTLRSVILPIVKLVVIRSIKGFFYKIGYLATHFEAAGYAAEVEANPAVYEWIKRRIHESVSAGKFVRDSSMMSLSFENLK